MSHNLRNTPNTLVSAENALRQDLLQEMPRGNITIDDDVPMTVIAVACELIRIAGTGHRTVRRDARRTVVGLELVSRAMDWQSWEKAFSMREVTVMIHTVSSLVTPRNLMLRPTERALSLAVPLKDHPMLNRDAAAVLESTSRPESLVMGESIRKSFMAVLPVTRVSQHMGLRGAQSRNRDQGHTQAIGRTFPLGSLLVLRLDRQS